MENSGSSWSVKKYLKLFQLHKTYTMIVLLSSQPLKTCFSTYIYLYTVKNMEFWGIKKSLWNNVIERACSSIIITWQENTADTVSMTNEGDLNTNFKTTKDLRCYLSLPRFPTPLFPREQHSESQIFTNELHQRRRSPKLWYRQSI